MRVRYRYRWTRINYIAARYRQTRRQHRAAFADIL